MTERPGSGEVPSSAGETISFSRIFEENVSYVWHALRRLGVPGRDCDDLVQEVFLTAHDLFEDFDPSRSPRPWLFAIAYRIALRQRRRFARRRESGAAEIPEVAYDAPPADDALVSAETRELVQAAIERIEITRRAVFVLKDLDGVDVPTIAHALGIPLNTAYSRLRLARDDFRVIYAQLAARRAPRPHTSGRAG